MSDTVSQTGSPALLRIGEWDWEGAGRIDAKSKLQISQWFVYSTSKMADETSDSFVMMSVSDYINTTCIWMYPQYNFFRLRPHGSMKERSSTLACEFFIFFFTAFSTTYRSGVFKLDLVQLKRLEQGLKLAARYLILCGP